MAPNPSVDPPPHHDGPHPAVSLIAGLGVIVMGATVVHVLFNAVF